MCVPCALLWLAAVQQDELHVLVARGLLLQCGAFRSCAANSALGFLLLVPYARGHLMALFGSDWVCSEIQDARERVASHPKGRTLKGPNLHLAF